jgi:membrane protease YdiL (CAAX protease family)
MENTIKLQSSNYTLLALFIGLVAYPVLYGTDFFGGLLFSNLPADMLTTFKDSTNRLQWWYFMFSNFAFHWIPFMFIVLALKKNNEPWSSIGVDWAWFSKYKVWFGLLLLTLIVAAIILPNIYYGDNFPTKSKAGFIGPISSPERLVMILLALTAAITEEVIFRGFALTRLKRWIPNPWFILPITVISFIFIHGEFRSVGQTLNYAIAALAFSIPFILMRLKRLEIVILIHFLIDASLVLVP